MSGASDLTESLRAAYGHRVRILHAPCMGGCDTAPVAAVGKNQIRNATTESVGGAIDDGAVLPVRPDYVGFEAYVADGGYETLKACREGTRAAPDVIATLEDSSLRGLGGAGFPTGRKWSIVRAQPAPRLMAVNADEGEPGTFKDRRFLETDPHRFLEGALIGQWAVGADGECFIYLRDEYPAARQILLDEIARLENEAIVTPGTLHVRRGAALYLRRGIGDARKHRGQTRLPRHKPPFAAEVGLFDRRP